MIKKITIAFALFAAFSGSALASTSTSFDGSSDLIEAFGGTRNGGDC